MLCSPPWASILPLSRCCPVAHPLIVVLFLPIAEPCPLPPASGARVIPHLLYRPSHALETDVARSRPDPVASKGACSTSVTYFAPLQKKLRGAEIAPCRPSLVPRQPTLCARPSRDDPRPTFSERSASANVFPLAVRSRRRGGTSARQHQMPSVALAPSPAIGGRSRSSSPRFRPAPREERPSPPCSSSSLSSSPSSLSARRQTRLAAANVEGVDRQGRRRRQQVDERPRRVVRAVVPVRRGPIRPSAAEPRQRRRLPLRRSSLPRPLRRTTAAPAWGVPGQPLVVVRVRVGLGSPPSARGVAIVVVAVGRIIGSELVVVVRRFDPPRSLRSACRLCPVPGVGRAIGPGRGCFLFVGTVFLVFSAVRYRIVLLRYCQK